MQETIVVEVEKPFVFITLNRPEVRNAMNQRMIRELLEVFNDLREDRSVRGIVVSGAGGTFCAGGDIKEMQAAYSDPEYDGTPQTRNFDRLLEAVNSAPQVVVTKIERAAMGGGLGLVCVSDIAIASEDTIFALPEVRLGIIPGLLAPYFIQRVGITVARRLMLTGARFDAIEALHYGLLHEAPPLEELEHRVGAALADIRECSPEAIAACKEMIFRVEQGDAPAQYRAAVLDQLRRSREGHEGMLAFIQKRKPEWATVDK